MSSTRTSSTSSPIDAKKLAGLSQATMVAGVDDGDAIAQAFRLVEIVGGHDDCDPGLVAEGGDDVEQVVADAGVQAHGRLVEEEHLGTRQERPDDLQPAAFPSAVGGDRSVDQVGEADRPGQRRRAGPDPRAGRTPQSLR